MTLDADSPTIQPATDGSVSVFPVTFKAALWKFVEVYRLLDGETEATLLTNGRHYWVSGDVLAKQGSVHFPTPPLATTVITIHRNTTCVQEHDYHREISSSNSLGHRVLPSDTHEHSYDRATMIAQEINDDLTRTTLVPRGEGTDNANTDVLFGFEFEHVFRARITVNNMDGTYDWVGVDDVSKSGTQAREFNGCSMIPVPRVVYMFETVNASGNTDYRFPTKFVCPGPGEFAIDIEDYDLTDIDVVDEMIYVSTERDSPNFKSLIQLSPDGTTVVNTWDEGAVGGEFVAIHPVTGNVWVFTRTGQGPTDYDAHEFNQTLVVQNQYSTGSDSTGSTNIRFAGSNATSVYYGGGRGGDGIWRTTGGAPSVYHNGSPYLALGGRLLGGAIDDSGNSYVYGFDNTAFDQKVVFRKYDSSDVLVWDQKANIESINQAGPDTSAGSQLAVDSSGNIYGYDFRPDLNGARQSIKWDSNGDRVWASNITGGWNGVPRVEIANDGNPIFYGRRDFQTQNNVIKMDASTGATIWAFNTSEGNSSPLSALGVKVTSTSVYVCGTRNPNYPSGEANLWVLNDPPTL